MIDLDYTFFIQLANFLVSLVVLNILLFKPIRAIIKQRNALMAEQMDKIEQFGNQAESKVKDYQAALDNARQEGNVLRAGFKDQGAAEEQKLLAEAGKDAASTMKAARDEIASQVQAAMAKLMGEVDGFAKKATAKILGQA